MACADRGSRQGAERKRWGVVLARRRDSEIGSIAAASSWPCSSQGWSFHRRLDAVRLDRSKRSRRTFPVHPHAAHVAGHSQT